MHKIQSTWFVRTRPHILWKYRENIELPKIQIKNYYRITSASLGLSATRSGLASRGLRFLGASSGIFFGLHCSQWLFKPGSCQSLQNLFYLDRLAELNYKFGDRGQKIPQYVHTIELVSLAIYMFTYNRNL